MPTAIEFFNAMVLVPVTLLPIINPLTGAVSFVEQPHRALACLAVRKRKVLLD